MRGTKGFLKRRGRRSRPLPCSRPSAHPAHWDELNGFSFVALRNRFAVVGVPVELQTLHWLAGDRQLSFAADRNEWAESSGIRSQTVAMNPQDRFLAIFHTVFYLDISSYYKVFFMLPVSTVSI